MFILLVSKWGWGDFRTGWGKNNRGRVLELSVCLIWSPVGPEGGWDSGLGERKWAVEKTRPQFFTHIVSLSYFTVGSSVSCSLVFFICICELSVFFFFVWLKEGLGDLAVWKQEKTFSVLIFQNFQCTSVITFKNLTLHVICAPWFCHYKGHFLTLFSLFEHLRI